MTITHGMSGKLKQRFEGLPHAAVHLGAHAVPTFRLCLAAGLTMGVALACALTAYRGLDVGVMTAVASAALLTFFALAMLTKIVTGVENMVHYHCVLAAISAAAITAWLLRQPILPYLDATILGIGVLAVCGRIGCLMAGCCHGRPHAWGVCYRDEHAAIGFPEYLVGVPLFPIQLVESLCALAIVAGGVVLILSGAAPGIALAWYVILYNVARFCIEFARGDLERSYRLNLSEAQWTALVLSGALVCAELLGAIPFQLWHSVVAVGLWVFASSAVIRGSRAANAETQWEQLPHLHELAKAVRVASRKAAHIAAPENNGYDSEIHVTKTRLGIQLSSSQIALPGGEINQFTFSLPGSKLSSDAAQKLAALIKQLTHSFGTGTLVETERGIFHLVLYPMIQQNKG